MTIIDIKKELKDLNKLKKQFLINQKEKKQFLINWKELKEFKKTKKIVFDQFDHKI